MTQSDIRHWFDVVMRHGATLPVESRTNPACTSPEVTVP